MTIKTERQAGISALIRATKATLREPLLRESLEHVSHALIALARNREYWSSQEFPPPSNADRQARYILHEESDGAYALYLNVMKKGKTSKPHDHTTWACIAGVVGVETNFLYKRIDGGTEEGHARLMQTGITDIGPGSGLALMPRDIHSISVSGHEEIRHLHFYGRSVELLTGRLEYDLATNSCRRRSVGVQTRRP